MRTLTKSLSGIKFQVYVFVFVLAFCLAPLSAQTVTFELIPDGAATANDMTPDGKYIVGNSNIGPYRYDTDTGQMLVLPGEDISASAVAVSDDGTMIIGNIDLDGPGGNQSTAGIWRQDTNEWTSLGFFPSAAAACGSLSSAYELSADGSVATGLGWVDGCNARAFRWSEATGLETMQAVTPGSPTGDRASVISGDGSLIAGFAQGSFSRTPAIWNGNDLSGELLDPPSGDGLGEIFGLKDDGSIMLGSWLGADETGIFASRAHTWTNNGAGWDRTLIGNGSIIPGWQGIPTDIANDNTIVGFDSLLQSARAWIQYRGQGNLILLKAWANSFGANIGAQQELQVCKAISTDGTIICGDGFLTGAWIVRIDHENLLGDVNMDGNVNLLDIAPFIDLISTNTFQAEADINQDGTVDLLDVGLFVDLLNG